MVSATYRLDLHSRLREATPLHLEAFHLLVKESLADAASHGLDVLQGRSVDLGPRGSGTAALARAVLAFSGVDLNAIDARYLDLDQLQTLTAGSAEALPDAIALVATIPSKVALGLISSGGYRPVAVPFAEAFRLALSYPSPHAGRELAQATLGMIGGQYLDITNSAPDEATLHKLKTGCLFAASVGLALWAAEVPEREQGPWRAFGDELGLLFQIVDDILDGDGYVATHGQEAARRLADQAASRARERLGSVPADTSVLEHIVDGLATRTS